MNDTESRRPENENEIKRCVANDRARPPGHTLVPAPPPQFSFIIKNEKQPNESKSDAFFSRSRRCSVVLRFEQREVNQESRASRSSFPPSRCCCVYDVLILRVWLGERARCGGLERPDPTDLLPGTMLSSSSCRSSPLFLHLVGVCPCFKWRRPLF